MTALNLRSKVNLAILATFIVIAVVFVGIQLPFQQRRMQTLKTKIDTLLQTLVMQHMDSLGNEIFENRIKAIRIRVAQMLNVEGILGICIFDAGGKLILSQGELTTGADLSNRHQEAAELGLGFRVVKRRWRDTNVLNYLQEIRVVGECMGYILVYYSLENAEREHQISMILFAGMLVSILIVMLLVLNLILSKTIIRPITCLHDTTRSIARGRLAEKIEIHRKDELGSLSLSIMHMRDAIREKIEALETAEEKYRQIFENAVEGLFRATADGVFIDANPALARIMGHKSAEQLLESETDMAALIPAGDGTRPSIPSMLEEKGRIINLETEIINALGDAVDISLSARAVRDLQGRFTHFEGSVVDITERKQKEQAERERETAEAATKAKSDFLAGMSHEIRTPINAIVGLTALALKTTLSPQQRNYLTRLKSSAGHLVGIINDILDFSKIEAGKLELETTDFCLSEVLDDVQGMFSSETEDKGIDLSMSADGNLPPMLTGDPLRLKQVLINLVGNAVKFTDTGAITVHVSMEHQSSGRARVGFSVKDTGIGMTPEQISMIFSSFAQAETSTSRKYGGSGLGLTICKRLVEMMNGDIRVASEPQRGSVFRFEVEFGIPAITKAAMAEHPETPSPDVMNILQGMAILVVEDSTINRLVTVEMLETRGVTVSSASNGKQAVDMVRNTRFDAVLMDVRMPEMDGYEATRLIRSDPAHQRLPIIALTANAWPGDREKCIRAGMDDYVPKPVEVKKLGAVLSRILNSPKNNAPDPPSVKNHPHGPQPDPAGELPPGIDMDAALERLKGNKALLIDMLKNFLTDYADVAEKIRERLENGQIEAARLLAHTVKGMAGNLSALEVFTAATFLEAALRHGQLDRFDPLMDNFETALNRMTASMKNLDNTSAPAGPNN